MTAKILAEALRDRGVNCSLGRLYRVEQGITLADPEEREAIAAILGTSEAALFGDPCNAI